MKTQTTQNKAKHTEGEWRVFDSERHGINIVTKEYTGTICKIETLIPREEAEANAKLIAQAPAMYSFLKKVSELGMTFGDMPTEESKALHQLWQEAEQLISKATN